MNNKEDENRFSLRLAKEMLNDIDASRATRSGKISRNTWIAEAIKEKLERDTAAQLRILPDENLL